MSQESRRAVPKWPIHFNQVFAAIDPISIVIGLGGGAIGFYLVQRFLLKKCIR